VSSLRVPATSANLGPGFDSLGVALGLYNRFHFEAAEHTTIKGCPPDFADENNLFLVAARRAAEVLGRDLPPLALRFETEVPVARGLGSSATLVVGGILAARYLLGGEGHGLDEQEVLDLAADIEGHPDNTTPALLGGFTVSVLEGRRCVAARRPLGKDLDFSAIVPPFPLETSRARAALPAELSFRDAAWNAGRAALVAAAFMTADWRLLETGMRDRLHEPWRAPLIEGYVEMVEAARAAGALGVFLSGAGPTVMAISLGGDMEVAGRLERACSSMLPRPWRCLRLKVDDVGAVMDDAAFKG